MFWFSVGKVQFVKVPEPGVPNAILAPKLVKLEAVIPDAKVVPVKAEAAGAVFALAKEDSILPLVAETLLIAVFA